ncbi:sigma-E factor regulatory protein RseB [Vibrio sp. SS-MA-C1-2]|uniref:sigma-E factor regulatory protein RseB n=1 Tax=Vibrio sp. SS-MA-C1-2 TaxID=2908646 RepID=UPI0038FC1E49
MAMAEQAPPQQVAAPVVKETPQAVLEKAEVAGKELNYEISYILVKKQGVEPVRYRHAVETGKQLAHLVYLSGPPREAIQRGSEVSYFEPGTEPFTIESSSMTGATPTLLNTNIAEISQHYEFISMGRSREAGSTCRVIRIAPKDGMRYSYIVWIDETSNLVLRADLLARDGEPLEQYRVVSYAISPKVINILSGLEKVKFPPAMKAPKVEKSDLNWHVSWVPKGFNSVANNRHRLMGSSRQVESMMFNDGLFSFSVYVAPADNLSMKNKLLREGRRTLQSIEKEGQEVIVVGDLPPMTAQRIANSVIFSAQ